MHTYDLKIEHHISIADIMPDHTDQESPTADDRLRAATNIAEVAETMRLILLDGIKMADEEVAPGEERRDDPSGCVEYLFECVRSTFEFVDTREENRLMRYTFAVLSSDPSNRDLLVKMMQDNWMTREIIAQQNASRETHSQEDADGSSADLLCKIRMSARYLMKSILEEVDRQTKSGQPGRWTIEDSSEDDAPDEDEIARAMKSAHC
jgi:hypothetical protein